MRAFIACTMNDLSSTSVPDRYVHARTSALEELVKDDEEMLDAMAMLAAADDSLRLIISQPEAAPRRVVVAADISAKDRADRTLPTEVEPTAEISWEDVVAIFVDEESAADAISQARQGGDDEFEAVAELDLLWYHPDERLSLV